MDQNQDERDSFQRDFFDNEILHEGSLSYQPIEFIYMEKDLSYYADQKELDNLFADSFPVNLTQATSSNSINSEIIITKAKKTKTIEKKIKFNKKKSTGKSQSNLLIKKEKLKNQRVNGNKSKYNNMGGFLIGSLSDIANQDRFSFQNGFYIMKINETQLNLIEIDTQFDQECLTEVMSRLKRKLLYLPRKEGSKSDLLKLINTEDKENQADKICKRLIRRQIMHKLKNDQWLDSHVYSRDFKPKDDDIYGTKKKERHQCYHVYLKAIREALNENDRIPKRLNLL